MKKSVIMAGCASFALAGQAALVVNYDGATADAITTSVNQFTVNGQTLAAGASYSGTRAYSTTTPWISSGTPAAYSGQSIYGGAYFRVENVSAGATTVGNTGVLRYQNEASGQPEMVQVSSAPASYDKDAIERQVSFAVLFGLNTAGSYGFDGSSVLTVKGRIAQSPDSVGATQTIDNRWVVVANGVTYVAQSSLGDFTTTATDYTLNNPDEINWAVWTPGADLSFGSLTYDVDGSTIDGITHAGIAGNHELGVGTGNRIYEVRAFSAELIPEPATVGLLILGGVSAMVLRRFNG